jgi:hypothetical protein
MNLKAPSMLPAKHKAAKAKGDSLAQGDHPGWIPD